LKRDGSFEFIARPLRDYMAAVDAMHRGSFTRWLRVVAMLVATWFVYVPIHELMHAYGCIAAGGSVTRLEVAPEYGGALLAQIFTFVVSGSSYAGQLTGFDTKGSDAIYLLTVLAPYLLTVFIGVPLLRRAAQPMDNDAIRPYVLGASLPVSYAPFISIFGDYYEAGSIVVSRLVNAIDGSSALARWRSDDLFKLIDALQAQPATAIDWTIVALAFLLGVVLALLTYHAGAVFSRLFSRRTSPLSEQSK
jgi:hypothetical protein